ncbi:hypothetical protein BRADI_4g11636v3 [Brachypodium distachyon]|uniref:Uncharacterized protein n=1 Tax=Brachypodium distachyon TaxID=15368 RepID=A0A2K2CM68_BRADI|nr:hypothetical protein BRADI_4g11636v3 [Brachypodium distachyon]
MGPSAKPLPETFLESSAKKSSQRYETAEDDFAGGQPSAKKFHMKIKIAAEKFVCRQLQPSVKKIKYM